MKAKLKKTIKKQLANFFNTLGYFFCMMQWLWALLMYSSLLVLVETTPVVNKNPIIPDPIDPQTPVARSLMIIFLAIFTAIVVVVAVVVAIKLPSKIAKAGKNVVSHTAKNTAPLIIKIQRKKDTKKLRAKLTKKTIIALKLIAILAPVFGVFASYLFTEPEIEQNASMIVAIGLAMASLLAFSTQYVLAKILKIKTTE